jgi:hypothetical protein
MALNTAHDNAARFNRLNALRPHVWGYATPTNGQRIALWEHPTQGGDLPVFAAWVDPDTGVGYCANTSFYEWDCDLQTKSYQPTFIDGVLYIGGNSGND